MAEFEQLATYALVTPQRVLPRQRQHQLPALGWQQRSTRIAAAAKRCPATMDERPMPAEDGSRLHQERSTA